MQRHLHPSKEQVRAYMHLREAERRPPPGPDEIRRQLGWQASSAAPALSSTLSSTLPSVLTSTLSPALFSVSSCTAPSLAGDSLRLPGAIAQLATLIAVEWCSLVAGNSRPR